MAGALYIHIPFCIKKCLYCDFLSIPYDNDLAGAYIDALCRELRLRKSSAGILNSVYLGGGTPSMLDAACFRKIFSCLSDNFSFSDSTEVTVEANPRTIDRQKVDILLSLGVNRISLGIQSFRDDDLRTLGRSHNADDAGIAAALFQEAGMKNLSLDLIYGIPGQTLNSWGEILSHTVSFSPSHISSYELTPEANTPLAMLIASGKISMPGEDLIISMYHHAIDYLSGHEYEHYEISNFALPGFKCIHNLNYWDRGEYIGAGAGAHSFIGGIRAKNIDNIRQYIALLESSVLPEAAAERLTKAEAARELVFLGLRKREGISLDAAKALGLDIPGLSRELIDEDYIRIDKDQLMLTRKGMIIANTVIVRLLEDLGL